MSIHRHAAAIKPEAATVFSTQYGNSGVVCVLTTMMICSVYARRRMPAVTAYRQVCRVDKMSL